MATLLLGVCLLTVFQLVSSQAGWSMTADVHGPGGVPQSVADVAACQTACIDDSSCVAIDWDPQNTGQECWILQVSYTGPTTQLGFIEHYALDRSALPVAPPAISCDIDLRSYSCCSCPNVGYVTLNAANVWQASWCGSDAFPTDRGISTFLIDVAACTVDEKKTFDTFASSAAAADLKTYLEGLPDGRVLVGATGDEPVNSLGSTKATLQSMGVDINDVGFRGSFGFVLQKGSPAKSVVAKVLTESASNPNPAELKASIGGTSAADLTITLAAP